MYNSPDWDPLKTLIEITENLQDQSQLLVSQSQKLAQLSELTVRQNTAITELVGYINQLNRRMVVLEQQLKQ